jgi:hypothetical protein
MRSFQFPLVLFVSLGLVACSDEPSSFAGSGTASNVSQEAPVVANGPASTKSPMWQNVVNSAKRTVDEYATERNPNAVFIGGNLKVDFVRQSGGEHEDR